MEVIGWVAALVNILAFGYQAQKTLRSKDVKNLSLVTFLINMMGCLLWLIYGLVVSAFQGVVVNAIVICVVSLIIFVYLGYINLNAFLKYLIVGSMISIAISLLVVGVVDSFINDIVNVENGNIKMVIGLAAGCCTAGAFMPQFIKIIKQKETKSLSYVLIILYGTAQFLWATFWILRSGEGSLGDWLSGFIFATLTGTLQVCILTYKYYLDRKFNPVIANDI